MLRYSSTSRRRPPSGFELRDSVVVAHQQGVSGDCPSLDAQVNEQRHLLRGPVEARRVGLVLVPNRSQFDDALRRALIALGRGRCAERLVPEVSGAGNGLLSVFWSAGRAGAGSWLHGGLDARRRRFSDNGLPCRRDLYLARRLSALAALASALQVVRVVAIRN